MAFNKLAFEAAFTTSIVALATSEKVTRVELATLSRTVLEAWHAVGNVDYANKLLTVLTPVNRKVAVVFFKHFSGFSYDDALGMFTKKSKKRYESAAKECVTWLEDPLNNIWTWAGRNIEIEQKKFDADAITKYMTSALKKAAGAGMSQADVMRAIFKAGIQPAALIEAFNAMEYKAKDGDVVEIPADVFGASAPAPADALM